MRRGVGLGLLLLSACAAHRPEPFSCDPEARSGVVRVERAIPGRYLVVMREPREPRAARALAVATTAGAADVATMVAAPGFAATMLPEAAARVAGEAGVLFVQEVGPKSVPPGEEAVLAPERTTRLVNLDRLDQRALPLDGQYRPAETGRGVHVYVVDTGVETSHPEFAGRVGAGFSSVGGSPEDEHGHGTHVAGTALGASVGVAPAATVHPVRVLDKAGQGSDETVLRGIDWVLADVERNRWPAVANFSIGGPASPALDLAIGRLRKAGVAVAVAAGNENGDACATSPARAECALTVGASEIWSGDGRDYKARFSNHGRCVDVFAIGVEVESAWLGGLRERHSGTSMATPAVSGLLALCLERGAVDPQACVLETATRGTLVGLDTETPNQQGYCLADAEGRPGG